MRESDPARDDAGQSVRQKLAAELGDDYDGRVRKLWAEKNAKVPDGFTAVEHYPAGDTSRLALRLQNDGLIYAINRELLHPLGLAIGVSAVDVEEETQTATSVVGLILFEADEPIEFGEGSHERGMAKLRATLAAQPPN